MFILSYLAYLFQLANRQSIDLLGGDQKRVVRQNDRDRSIDDDGERAPMNVVLIYFFHLSIYMAHLYGVPQ